MSKLGKAAEWCGALALLNVVAAGVAPAFADEPTTPDPTKSEPAKSEPAKPGKAESKGVYTGKISLTGFYYTESDGIGAAQIDNDPTVIGMHVATSSHLGYGELRAVADARRIANERIDFHFDVRLRATGSFDFERKYINDLTVYDPTKDSSNSLGTSAQGYLGGPEYDLREAYLNVHFTPSVSLQIGRMLVHEADNIKLDGLRLVKKFGQHWEGTAFAGGYPNPYSRSLLTDYVGPCGDGVAGSRDGIATEGPCTTLGAKLGFGVGVGARYNYNSLWGSFALVGSAFAGMNTGGPVAVDPAASLYGSKGVSANQANLIGPDDSLDAPRIYLSWLNSWRPHEKIDLFTDLVFDLYGSAGAQLTRLVALGTFRILKDERLTMRVGFSYMSSLAIDMFLNRLVYNRLSGTTLAAQGISAVENNLTILRTGRAEGRVTLDARLFKRLGIFVEGRVRYRSLVNGASDPNVYITDPVNAAKDSYSQNVPAIAGDGTVGIRDNGSIRYLRGGLSYNIIFDYLAQNHVVNFDIGTDLWQDRLGLTLSYTAAITKESQAASMDSCLPSAPYPSCFGNRSGKTHEIGLTASLNPFRTLFFVLDYRFIAMLTDEDALGIDTPTVLSHAILFRTEFRW